MKKMKRQTVENINAAKETDKTVSQKKLVATTALKALTLTENQKKLLKIIEDNKIIVISGPAGTGKTAVECYYAIQSLIKHTYNKVIFSKPIEESGERLGFLPGDIAAKIGPYLESYKGNLLKFVSKTHYEKLVKEEVLDYRALAYLRGVTFEENLMILDEAQNCDIRQIILFVTRMGKGSKVIISGDTRQIDIGKDTSCMKYFAEMIKGIPKTAHFEFKEEDIMRDPILIEITKRYETSKMDEKLPRNKK